MGWLSFHLVLSDIIHHSLLYGEHSICIISIASHFCIVLGFYVQYICSAFFPLSLCGGKVNHWDAGTDGWRIWLICLEELRFGLRSGKIERLRFLVVYLTQIPPLLNEYIVRNIGAWVLSSLWGVWLGYSSRFGVCLSAVGKVESRNTFIVIFEEEAYPIHVLLLTGEERFDLAWALSIQTTQ